MSARQRYYPEDVPGYEERRRRLAEGDALRADALAAHNARLLQASARAAGGLRYAAQLIVDGALAPQCALVVMRECADMLEESLRRRAGDEGGGE